MKVGIDFLCIALSSGLKSPLSPELSDAQVYEPRLVDL